MLELLSNEFRITALFLLVAFGIVFYIYEEYSFKKNIVILFLCTVIGFLLAYWEPIQATPIIFRIAFSFSVSLPVAFWLMSKALFDDNFEWNNKYWFIAIGAPVLINVLYTLNEFVANEIVDSIRFLPYLISVIFIVLVIYEALKNKDGDLVLARIKKRNVFVLFSSFLALLSVYFFFVEDPMKLPVTFGFIQNLVICVFIFLFFSSQFQYKTLFVVHPTSSNKKAHNTNVEIQKRIIKKLLSVFENDKQFTNEGITITQLANILNEKEYLLRQAINRELGYTNFNSFLNHYRINEACRLIQQNTTKELTFQEIAFQMGYQSVATFNRAFKKETGLTPSQFSETKI